MDEYKISKILRKGIEYIKPCELAEIVCKDLKLISYGFDYDIIHQY